MLPLKEETEALKAWDDGKGGDAALTAHSANDAVPTACETQGTRAVAPGLTEGQVQR